MWHLYTAASVLVSIKYNESQILKSLTNCHTHDTGRTKTFVNPSLNLEMISRTSVHVSRLFRPAQISQQSQYPLKLKKSRICRFFFSHFILMECRNRYIIGSRICYQIYFTKLIPIFFVFWRSRSVLFFQTE